jgi:hypothetical protein
LPSRSPRRCPAKSPAALDFHQGDVLDHACSEKSNRWPAGIPLEIVHRQYFQRPVFVTRQE